MDGKDLIALDKELFSLNEDSFDELLNKILTTEFKNLTTSKKPVFELVVCQPSVDVKHLENSIYDNYKGNILKINDALILSYIPFADKLLKARPNGFGELISKVAMMLTTGLERFARKNGYNVLLVFHNVGFKLESILDSFSYDNYKIKLNIVAMHYELSLASLEYKNEVEGRVLLQKAKHLEVYELLPTFIEKIYFQFKITDTAIFAAFLHTQAINKVKDGFNKSEYIALRNTIANKDKEILQDLFTKIVNLKKKNGVGSNMLVKLIASQKRVLLAINKLK